MVTLQDLVRLETVTRESELNTSSPTLTTSTAPDFSQLTWKKKISQIISNFNKTMDVNILLSKFSGMWGILAELWRVRVIFIWNSWRGASQHSIHGKM